jgi:hypothetical protein
MFIVVAVSEVPGPPGVSPRRGFHLATTRIPVGVRHAVPLLRDAGTSALCGVDVTGWPLFPDMEFQPGHAASCQRCAQLVSDNAG